MLENLDTVRVEEANTNNSISLFFFLKIFLILLISVSFFRSQ